MISFTHAEVEKIIRDTEAGITKYTLDHPVDPFIDQACLSGIKYMRRSLLIQLDFEAELSLTQYAESHPQA